VRGWHIAGIVFVFLWFALGGLAHFAYMSAEMSIVPPYLGDHQKALVIISGIFELLGALGLLLTATRRAAGMGLFALTIAVTPANVYMLQRADLFHVPVWLLVARLPMQVALLALIYWATIRRPTLRA
jgi:uncharacterized membrane protein